MPAELDFSQLDRWIKRAEQLGLGGKQVFMAELVGLAEDIVDDVNVSPNAPPRGARMWYERGFGRRWPTGGQRTSERAPTKWQIAAVSSGVAIRNTAGYAEWIYGERQASFHRAQGWRRLKERAEKHAKRFKQRFFKRIRQRLT